MYTSIVQSVHLYRSQCTYCTVQVTVYILYRSKCTYCTIRKANSVSEKVREDAQVLLEQCGWWQLQECTQRRGGPAAIPPTLPWGQGVHTTRPTVSGQFSICQSWALALFFQVRSPLNFYPWIAIALSLILPIFRFTHSSIALQKISGSLLEKSAITLDHS